MNKERRTWGWVLVIVLVIAVGWAIREPAVQDFWKGLSYHPDEKVAQMEADLQLTGTGRRIFAATRPVIEGSSEFNEHCQSHNVDVTLLGCYTEGRVYVYEVTEDELRSSNIVTTAHELLHAVWERMGAWERSEVEKWLEMLYQEKKEWFDEELKSYGDDERLEEVYTRAATKLADLPEQLEQHYAKFFENRGKIVEAYRTYEAPFLRLQAELDQLLAEIMKVKAEVEEERKTYLTGVERLDGQIDEFNRCANTAGCFTSESEFSRRRQSLLSERTALESMRERLNGKITENNGRIEQYRMRQQTLGRLNDAMNSNIELVEVVE